MQNKLDKALDLLERPAYVQVLLCVASGKDYATSIARFLKKKQPTVTEQLQELKNAGLIRELERGKYKRFKVNWDLLLKVFYDTVSQLLDLRKFFIDVDAKWAEKLRKAKLEGVVPPELVKSFLTEYFSFYVDFGGKAKGFDEIIFSFFSAINHLDRRYWKLLVSKFEIDEESLAALADMVEFEIYGPEMSALTMLLESESGGEKSG